MRAVLLLLALSLVAAVPEGPGWRRLDAPPATIHHREADSGLARRIAEATLPAAEKIHLATGLSLPRHVDVVLSPDAATFDAVQDGTPPSWAAGTAWPELGEIHLRTGRVSQQQPLEQVYLHELLHVALGRRLEAPRWLDEGLARLVAGERDPQQQVALLAASLTGKDLPLEAFLHRWPAGASQAQLAYAESVDFVGFVARQRPGAIPALIDALAGGHDVDAALQIATGRSLPELERAWQHGLSPLSVLLPLLGMSGLPWMIAAALLVVGGVRARRRYHRRLRQMQAEEEARWAAWSQPPAEEPVALR